MNVSINRKDTREDAFIQQMTVRSTSKKFCTEGYCRPQSQVLLKEERCGRGQLPTMTGVSAEDNKRQIMNNVLSPTQ